MKLLFAAIAALTITTSALAQSADAPAPSTIDFVKEATIGGLFEMDTSRLALQQSKDPDVIRFAQRMVQEHGDTNNALKMTVRASKLDVELPTVLDDAHGQTYEAMKKLSGKDFDNAYITTQTNAHFEAVALFVTYAKGGSDPKLKSFAAETVPHLRAHQDALAHLHAR